jgi:hypothetical protein
MNDFLNLHNKILNSKGYSVDHELLNLSTTQKIFNTNYLELVELKQYLSENPDLWHMQKRDKLDQFQLELARRLHNFLASVKSLVDQTRSLKKRLKLDENFEIIYEKKRQEYFGLEEFSFVQQLREYVQHYSLLPTGLQMNLNANKENASVLTLSKEKLMKFSNWNAHSKVYLKESPENIDLMTLITNYQDTTNNFYSDFYEMVVNVYKDELLDFRKLTLDMAKKFSK